MAAGEEESDAASVPEKPGWEMWREMMSRSYTTKLDQLRIIKSNSSP
jgi:DNA polymerase V